MMAKNKDKENFLLAESKRIIKAWEKLDEGNHHPNVIEHWLINDMKPAIDKLRKKMKKYESRNRKFARQKD